MKALIECGLCKRKFECKPSESPNVAAKRHKLASASFDAGDESFEIYLCHHCYSALRNDNIETKKAARFGKYASHVYLPADVAGREVIMVYKSK